jgi:hypothetical protein
MHFAAFYAAALQKIIFFDTPFRDSVPTVTG